MEKNFDNIKSKREKTIKELVLLVNQNKDRINTFQSGIVQRRRLIKLKKFQLRHLDWMEKTPIEDIWSQFSIVRQKLCFHCRKHLFEFELMCDKDLFLFVWCEMVIKATINPELVH